ncbi:uncharacterized protein LOC17883364 [Capsella rubella]|uniref:uncharacterized protein LOC17883364 n=1 Tax=Capsella rubella TaxID=81985 RepID=UPI000CD58754|nr:uncharacterized protein LOC17883364 [Capsella rubella]
MGEFQNSDGYNYLFGEADEITKRLEEYHRERGRVLDDSQVPHVNNSPMVNHHYQNQPTIPTTRYYNPISSEHYYHSSQDIISPSVYHRQFQSQPNSTRHALCWKCLIWWLISMLRGLFVPRPTSRPIHTPIPFNSYPHHSLSGSERFGDRPDQQHYDHRIQERERVDIDGGGEALLTAKQISQLPTVKFKPSIQDKTCMACHLDFANGDKMTILPCTHKYHKDCICRWFKDSKLCCVCKREVVV